MKYLVVALLLLTMAAHTKDIDPAAVDWTTVDKIVNDAISNRDFPGALLGVATSKSVLYLQTYGTLTYKQELYSIPVTMDTRYDLASLTKVVATLSGVMHLYDDKKLAIDDPVSKYIPEYDNNQKRNTTIKNLLLHNAGLLPDYPSPLPATKQ